LEQLGKLIVNDRLDVQLDKCPHYNDDTLDRDI